MPRLIAENRLWFGKEGAGVPRIKRFLSEVKQGIIPQTLWKHEEVGNTQEAKKEVIALNSRAIFDTPKPERLIYRILSIATEPGDLVLDSFAGSGTTGAVAHKMRRRWIAVELGEHCHTHIIPRLKNVIDGVDLGGIVGAVNWKGGGGFRYYRLAPSLLEEDTYGNPIINKRYNAAMLAEAMCKHFGFRYDPSDSVYWQQGRSSESDFLYTTTQTLSVAQLRHLSEEVGPDRSLLICATAFRAKASEFPNLELRKIPEAVRKRCEWGKDDYSLKVENLPMASPAPPDGAGTQATLFEQEAQ